MLVDLCEVARAEYEIAFWLHSCPRSILKALNQAATEQVFLHYPDYDKPKIFVRLEAAGLIKISDLRYEVVAPACDNSVMPELALVIIVVMFTRAS